MKGKLKILGTLAMGAMLILEAISDYIAEKQTEEVIDEKIEEAFKANGIEYKKCD